MKKNHAISLLLCLLVLFEVSLSLAQAPEKFKYQAVLRDASGNIIANTAETVTIEILQGSASGTSVYKETQNVTTTAQGVINLDLGAGTVISGVFANINWSTSSYWVKVSLGSTVISTGQLLSVPYSLSVKGVTYDSPTGYIGIGTSSPDSKLTVAGVIHSTNDNSACFKVGNDATINDINLGNGIGIYGTYDNTIGHIKLGSGGPTLSGKTNYLGIGTTSPTSLLHLFNTTGAGVTVESSSTVIGPMVELKGSSSGKTWQLLSTGTGSSSGIEGNFELWQTLGTALTVKGTNNFIGIGTTNPDFRLTVAGVIRSTYNGAECFRVGDDAGLWDINVGSMMGVYSSSDNAVGGIKLGSGGEYLYGKSGNIGIGTTTPGNKLEVNGTGMFRGDLNINTGSNDAALHLGPSTKRAIGYAQNWDQNRLYINGWGDWGSTQVSNYFYAASNVDIASTLGVFGNNLYLKGASGDVSYRLGNNSFDRRSMGYYPGWDGNMLYINGFRDWSSGVSIGHWQGQGNLNDLTTLYLQGTAYSQGGYLISSDARLKTNVESMKNSLDKVLKMRGVTYTLKNGNLASFGFIAQELESVFPLAVNTDKMGYKAVNYGNLTAVLAEAIKELNAKVEKLEKENTQLKAETADINNLRAELEGIKTLIKSGNLLGKK